MHPDVFDAEFHALVNDLLRHLRVGKDEDRVHFFGKRFQVGVARIPLECGDARVDRVDLIAIVLEFFIYIKKEKAEALINKINKNEAINNLDIKKFD